MDSPADQFPPRQDITGSQTLESMRGCGPKPGPEKQARPVDMQAQKCPRCDSSNTKFCYYNNYSLSQPRYFCKSCRRYWTRGGTLRNVPVGGGCRKNKRPPSSSSKRSLPHPIPCPVPSSYDSNDLALALADDNGHLSVWGNQNDHRYPGLGAFLERQPPAGGGIQNLYYGSGNGNDHLEIGSGAQEMGILFDEFGGVKQEGSRAMWGFPWQSGIVGGADSSWNGIGSTSSNWHGLLNSPLM